MRRGLVVLALAASCRFEPGVLPRDGGRGNGDIDAPDGGDVMPDDAPPQPAPYCRVMLGSDHSCAVRTSDNTMWCAGNNSFGELGGSSANSFSTSSNQVNIGSVVAAASRSYHACAALPNGSVTCWGMNEAGQLGDGTYTTRGTPAAVMNLANAVDVVAGRSFTCARRSDNSITCWGSNSSGQFGDGTFAPQPTPATTVTGLTQTPIEITTGSGHACARYANGDGACWGGNTFGQLGDGTQTNRETPIPMPVTGIAMIAPGGYTTGEGSGGQTCALLATGGVQCWGSNNFGQLGNGMSASTPSLTPVTVSGITDGVELVMGRYHVCARHGAGGGSVSCWGMNNFGQIGDGTSGNFRTTPTSVTLPRPARHVATGGWHTCAVLDDDSVYCWGLNNTGQLADGTQTLRTMPVASALCP